METMKRSFMKDLKLILIYWMFTSKCGFTNSKLVYNLEKLCYLDD